MAADIIRDNRRTIKNSKTLTSGLESLVGNIMGGDPLAPQINRTDTLDLNLRRSLLTMNRPSLNYLYQEYGVIRTAIDQPVDDALRGGLDFESDELSPEDLQALHDWLDDNEMYDRWASVGKWARLFGGAGLVINNGQDYSQPLDEKSMGEDTPLKFYAADRWELSMPNDKEKKPELMGYYPGGLFYYYTLPVHKSRVFTTIGDPAPSLIRRMLMGWGLSACEKMVRDLNGYIKAMNLIFELLDEAKIDVYMLQGYKSALAKPGGQAKMQTAIGLTNSLKNYMNALILDKEDGFDQKQITFSGLAEMLKEIRIGVASTLRMPVTKLYGISAAGFNSGEDDIENYNAMVESDVRSKLRPVIKATLGPICQKVYGYQPSIKFKFKSLRIVSTNEEEDIKTKKHTRIIDNFGHGLLTPQEAMEVQRAEGLLTIQKTEAEQGLIEEATKRGVPGQEEGKDEGKKGDQSA